MANEEKFTGIADIYAKYRPDYPQPFIDYLFSDEVGLQSGSIACDIGAGTGILTEQLLARGATVIAVEPNHDMMDKMQARLQSDQVQFVSAPAEDTGLPAGSVDYITVAQAFHWFDAARFRAECQRILRPGGKVILVWNHRDEASIVIRKSDAIHRQYCTRFGGFSGGEVGNLAEQLVQFFARGRYDHRAYRNDLPQDHDAYIGRNLSSSYAPRPNELYYAQYMEALEDLYDEYNVDGLFTLPNITRSYVGEV